MNKDAENIHIKNVATMTSLGVVPLTSKAEYRFI